VATKADITTTARTYLRDFKKPFQQTFVPMGRMYDMGKPNIESSTLYVAYIPQGGTSASVLVESQYELDARNGQLRLVPQLNTTDTLMVEGYYYEWLLPDDLDFYADMAINLNTHNLRVPLANMAPAVADVIGIHTLVQALWGLLSEFSRDIDVITSESVHIQSSQRYRMVSSLLDYWMAEYNKRAQALNIGLERLEVVNLRRISRTTNRLVPLYKPREVGDYGPIERIWPEIDDGLIDIEEEADDTRQEVYLDGEPPPGYLSTGQY
jgi:hypothetical protein